MNSERNDAPPQWSNPLNENELGRVISVNVGRPRDIPWKNTTVRTGFRKDPVQGRVKLVGNNLEGDGQADLVSHGGTGKTIFLYPHAHFPMWTDWLGRQPSFGMFGENLTVEGFAEEDLAVGDVLRIGSTTLVVTEPRQPCYKVDVSLGRDGAAVEMVRTGTIGFYLGVAERGDIGAGDIVERISGPTSDRISTAELHRLNTAATIEDLDQIEHHSRNDLLPASWREMLKVKAEGLRRRAARANRPWNGLRDFTVARVVSETSDVRSVYLELSDGGAAPSVLPGQFVTLRLLRANDAEGRPVDRSYTVSGSHSTHLRVTVRRAPRGGGGSLLVHSLKVGDTVGVRAPAGDFNTAHHPVGAHAVLVSAGIGITPMVTMAGALQGRAASVTAIHALHDATSDALVNELCEKVSAAEGRMVLAVSDGAPHPAPVEQVTGRITLDVLAPLLMSPSDTHVYVCGPESFMAAMRANAAALGVPDSQVRDEGFEPANGDWRTPEVPDGGHEVFFLQNARTLLWMDAEETLADIADAADAEVQTSCGQGVCGTCVTRLVEGRVDYVRDPARTVPDGWCIPCIAVPASNVTLDA